jgi:hypothetical protein
MSFSPFSNHMQELSTDISKNHYLIAISQDGKFAVTFDTGKKSYFYYFIPGQSPVRN